MMPAAAAEFAIPDDRPAVLRTGLKLISAVAVPSLDDPVLAQRFIAEDRTVTLRNVRILCWIAMALMPFAGVLDVFVYPDLLKEFFILRVLSSLCQIPVLLTTNTWLGQRYYRAYTVIVPMIPAFFISMMIRASGEPWSNYYAGLTLCLVAIGLMFHWTFRESAIAILLVFLFYLTATSSMLWHGIPKDKLGIFINNCVFIFMNSVVILSGSFYHHRIRIREFLVRTEVEQQREVLEDRNDELVTTLTQLRETESQLFQSEKLASLGRMSAGIIHEINNPLNFTNQAIFVLKKKGKHLPEGERDNFERILNDVKEGIGRVSSIVSDLRSFSHPDSGSASAVSLADVVQNAARLMSNELKDHNVDFDAEVPENMTVMGDRNQIIQVLINLVQNAIDASMGRPEPLITVHTTESLGRQYLHVRDNGCGIPAENLAKIFDPFFTTKEVGEGMGMGLSVSFRMMNQMGGGIEVTSEVDQGTEFTLWFPAPTLGTQGGFS
ncbi:MAG: Two-component system, sensor histidine kinase PhcS [Verrucomicrobiaceae bacterium]|nr:Two-component system, sensor histidine kinase PhcS [Verrucomicrobiaceae bacterium]